MAKTAANSEDETGLPSNRWEDALDAGVGSQLARQQKLDKQKALMEQKKRQRQMQNGMVMASNLGSRPFSSKHLRTSSRPQTSLGLPSKGSSTNPVAMTSPVRRLSSSSSSAPEEHDEASLLTPTPHDYATMETTAFSNSLSRHPQEEEKPSSKPSPSVTAAKLMAMGIASSLDYDSSSDKEDGQGLDASTVEGMDATMEETGDASAMVAPRLGATTAMGGATAVGEAPPIPSQEIESSRNAMLQALIEQLQNIKEFVMKPAPEGVTIKCRITRQKKPSSLYLLHLEADVTGTEIFLLAAQKRKRNRSSNYLISVDHNDLERTSENVVSKLRSNFVGTSFTIYDNGVNPEDTKAMPDGSNVRQELAAVHYETNVLGFKGPRKMSVIIPVVHANNARVVVQPKSESETLLSRWKNNQTAQLLELYNKQPVWSEETQAYVLNFHGRVTQASVKNFQLIHGSNPTYVVVQFGRVSEDIFTLDYNFPASAVQAFAIALSSFDSKLACE